MTTPNQRFVEKMREQLRFLQRSCAAFDHGAEDEAIRIATTLRVIFHNTQKSTSLITHLRLVDVKMLSSSRGHGNYHDYLSFRVDTSSPNPMKAVPMLGANFRQVPLSVWWATEPVFVHNGEKFSRKKIILCAANKDGGAHVDDTLDKFYEELSSGKEAFGFTSNLTFSGPVPFENGVTYYAKNAHLALLRQFGHEAVMSAALFPPP